ncbi:hypothetical protein HHK36_022190 [Tetracentron sinense]|uniref:beta-glucosidase n=1 Tax=Tetracentron sinense TaxID=13715 RepID=A0A834YTW3_TETSI|nr:hypothetical protein HHK36_022190 [Tetracentron sinense]
MERQRRRGSNSLWVSEETIQWSIKTVKDFIDSLGYCFRKFKGRRCTLMGEKRSNVNGEFIVFQAYLGEGAGGRVIIPRGNSQSGWVALLSALGVVNSSHSCKGKGGMMLSRPVMRYGRSVIPREEFVSLNEKERTSKKVEVDQANGDFQHWAMAVVCSITSPEWTDDWQEVAKIINKLILEEESVTLFPFEAHRAIYHTKKESHISSPIIEGTCIDRSRYQYLYTLQILVHDDPAPVDGPTQWPNAYINTLLVPRDGQIPVDAQCLAAQGIFHLVPIIAVATGPMSRSTVRRWDPQLGKSIGAATALEVRATGIPYVFAPCIALQVTFSAVLTRVANQAFEKLIQCDQRLNLLSRQLEIVLDSPYFEPRAPIFEDPDESNPLQLNCTYSCWKYTLIFSLFLKNKVAPCAKHFVDDGGTNKDINENNTVIDRPGLLCIHLPAYYNSIIKGGIGRITSLPRSNYTYSVLAGIQAGIDKVMVPLNHTEFIDDVGYLVKNKFIPMSRIDDVVRRILRVKFTMGLFENPLADLKQVDELGSQVN